MKKVLLTIMGMLLLTSNLALAAIPNVINYQGRLTDTGGNPYADGTYTMAILIYNVPTGGTALDSESHNVTTKNGYFNIQIGTGTPAIDLMGLGFNEEYYIAIQINPDLEMTPRKKITSVGYAIRADKATLADSATTATTATNAGQLGGVDAANFITKNTGSVTSADIAAGAVDTQTKVPWAPIVAANGGVILNNPKILIGTISTTTAGSFTINITGYSYTSVPKVFLTMSAGQGVAVVSSVSTTTITGMLLNSAFAPAASTADYLIIGQ